MNGTNPSTSSGLRQAVILAGGRGLRLRPLTDDCPKPMILVKGRPFLAYLIDLLRQNGIKEVVLLLGYLPEKFIEYFGDGKKFGLKIKYSIGEINDETGTRIKNALPLLKNKFLLLYADNYWPFDLAKMAGFYSSKKVLATTTVYNNLDGQAEYGWENNIYVKRNGLVGFYDKSRKDRRLNGVDIGFFILNKKVVKKMPNYNFSFERDFLPRLIATEQLAAYRTNKKYYTITTPELVKKIKYENCF